VAENIISNVCIISPDEARVVSSSISQPGVITVIGPRFASGCDRAPTISRLFSTSRKETTREMLVPSTSTWWQTYSLKDETMYAKLIIVGNLGGDPEMRYTPDGTPVTNFSVAVNRRWNNADGS
jgi:hypothetical protein